MASEFNSPGATSKRGLGGWFRAIRSPAAAEDVTALPPAAGLPFEAMLEAAPEPVLLVADQESGGLSSRRVIYANDAARALFRIPPEGALLASVIRHPQALEVVERCLGAGTEANAAFDFGGPPTRSWRASARPLTGGGGRPPEVEGGVGFGAGRKATFDHIQGLGAPDDRSQQRALRRNAE